LTPAWFLGFGQSYAKNRTENRPWVNRPVLVIAMNSTVAEVARKIEKMAVWGYDSKLV